MPIVRRPLLLSIVLVLAATTGFPARAANVAVVRAESLDSVRSDLDRLSNLELLPWLQGVLGLPDLSWVDRDRPLAVALPVAGMPLGPNGMVAAFPVTDAGPAMQTLSRALGNLEPDETGLLEIESEGETRLVIRPLDGLLVAGRNRDLVLGFDPQSALDPGDLPPGNLALEVDLQSIAPMAMMGLAAARQTVEQQIAIPDESGNALDPETAKEMTGIWFQLVQDLLGNTSRMQLSIEVGADHVVAHKRLIPLGASTLAGLIGAQRGGLPEIARHLDAADADMVMAGQLTYTPAFVEASQSYLKQYFAMMQGVGKIVGEVGGAQWIGAALATASSAIDKWPECYRGDMAGTFSLGEGGFRTRQLLGVADADICRSMFSEFDRATADLPQGPDGMPVVTITENALEYRGVSARLQETRLPLPEEADEAAGEILSSWFGGESILSYQAVTDDLILSTAGAGAEQEFKELVDRLSAERNGGLMAETFAPLRTGPGLFFVVDLGAMLRSFSGLPGIEEDGDLPDLPDGAGRFVYGARFEDEALTIELAVPLGFIDALGKAAEKSPESPPASRS